MGTNFLAWLKPIARHKVMSFQRRGLQERESRRQNVADLMAQRAVNLTPDFPEERIDVLCGIRSHLKNGGEADAPGFADGSRRPHGVASEQDTASEGDEEPFAKNKQMSVDILEMASRELPDEQRAFLTSVLSRDRTLVEWAAKTNMATETVRKGISRSYTELRDCMRRRLATGGQP